MSLQQALLEGAQVTVVGLAIVFAVLVILMFVLIAMKKIFYKDTAAQNTAPKAAENVPEEAVQQAQTEPVNDEELIAVITAAVAASLNTSTYNLQIKSLRRIGQNSPAWHRAGINETINSRF